MSRKWLVRRGAVAVTAATGAEIRGRWRQHPASTRAWTISVSLTRWESPRARGAGRVVSSRGEQGAVRPARAAGAAGSPILFFVRAVGGAPGRGGGARRPPRPPPARRDRRFYFS